ncbi:MAG: flagellar biosynthetic protein FliR [Proteobacteria bacterium]|nr:flagellar biosynthetic protein FliR [Pseudomonadota bacterium]
MNHWSIPIAQYIFVVAAILCRIGTAAAYLPVIGEMQIPSMVRVIVAAGISICLAMALPELPSIPGSTMEIGLLLFAEGLIGTAFGMSMRIVLSAMHTVGLVVATQAGLATAMMFDPSQGSQSAPIGTFLTMTAIMLLLAFDLHLVMIEGAAHSYDAFPLGGFYEHTQSFATMMMHAASVAFNTGIKMSFAFIIIGSLIYTAAGVAARLMPNLPVFILMIPGQIAVMLWFLMLSLSGLLLWFIDYYQDSYRALWE